MSHIVLFYFVCNELGYVDVMNTTADSSVCGASVAMFFAHMIEGKHLYICNVTHRNQIPSCRESINNVNQVMKVDSQNRLENNILF